MARGRALQPCVASPLDALECKAVHSKRTDVAAPAPLGSSDCCMIYFMSRRRKVPFQHMVTSLRDASHHIST
eukprot:444773-Prymnesium_polylepis.2